MTATPTLTATPTATPTPQGVCGDHILAPDEECDDGNTTSGDGCDADCTFTRCGNGILTPFEECDDGNSVNGDGCSTTCEFEVCDATCSANVCGNHVINGTEQCDDGAANGSDNCCKADCTLVDRDSDGTCDALDPCTLGIQVQTAKITLTKATNPTSPAPSFQKLTFKGVSNPMNFTAPFPSFNPALRGIRLVVTDVTRANVVLDVTLGGGTYDLVQKRGWRATGNVNYGLYLDKSAAAPGRIVKARVQRYSQTDGDRVKFVINGKGGAYPMDPTKLPLIATLVLDPLTADVGMSPLAGDHGQCTVAEFVLEDCFSWPRPDYTRSIKCSN